LFDLPPRTTDGPPDDATPEPIALDALALHWQLLVGRDRRPNGVRLSLRRRAGSVSVPLSALLDAVVRGFQSGPALPFPHGLVLLAPLDAVADAALAHWSAPRNVLLEIGAADLQDQARVRLLFDSRQRGVRQALRVTEGLPAPERLQFFQYLLAPAACAGQVRVPVLALDVHTPEQARAAFEAGAHGVVGWPLEAPQPAAGRTLSPSQRAIFELVRLIQADAQIGSLEQVFESEPLLAYLLLTLANSVAFRRGAPTASLRQAVISIGYQRLIKWLVLMLAISAKDERSAPLIFTTLVRGYCMENLCQAAGAPRDVADEAFVVGAFSLLDRITGQSLPSLLEQVGLPEDVVAALVQGGGPYAPYLAAVRCLEGADAPAHDAACAALPVDGDRLNHALLHAIAAADALLSVI